MIICVSGFMAAGKNVACEILEQNGFVSIDADVVVHDAVEKKSKEIANAFAKEAGQANVSIINSDGTINRREVGKLIFGNKELVSRQEQIVFPEVINQIKNFIDRSVATRNDENAITHNENDFAKQKKSSHIIINAIALFKTPELLEKCDAVIFVTAPFFVRLFRAKRRDNIALHLICARFKMQKNLLYEYKKYEYKKFAKAKNAKSLPIFIVKNIGSKKKLEAKLKKIIQKISDCAKKN